MIVPMKKITVVLTEDSRKASLKTLRQAGMLHIERIPGEGRAPEELVAEAEYLESALQLLPNVKVDPFEGTLDREAAKEKARSVLELKEQEKQAHAEIARFSKDVETLSPWGDFDPADLRILSARGVDIRLVAADPESRSVLADSESCDFVVLGKDKKITYGMAVNLGDTVDDDIAGLELPEYGLSELGSLIEEKHAELGAIEAELNTIARNSGFMEAALAQVRQEVEFEEIRTSLAGEDGLAWFVGYLPADDVSAFSDLAATNSWGLMINDPGEEDPVPTKVQNNAAIRMIQPVFDLMGIYPGYREFDISIWFLTFLSIFVAMILGDAGYGLVILILTTIFRIKAGKPSNTLRLMTLFGATTFIWGVLTGTWFSSLPLVANTPLRSLVVPALATYQDELFPGYTVSMSLFPGDELDATAMVKWISLLFGVVMLSIARIQSFIRKMPSLAALAQLGWLSIVLALYWLIMQLVLQLSPLESIMNLVLPMILGGIALIVLFGGQQKGQPFFKGVVAGLKDILPTALDSIGAFGDIISFIRLFAVGLAGVALSQSFNSMAPTGGGATIIAAVLILVFGHTLNLVLSALSVLVHGVRLNVLEFSGHLDMEWAGIGFDPFRLKVPEAESPETDKE